MSYGAPIVLRGQVELEQVAPAARPDVRPQAEAQFIEKLKRGDEAAFETLVNERSGEIYGLLYRLTENGEEARDLTQETFLRAFQSIVHFRGDSDLRTWIYRIAINQARNRWRWWRRRRPLRSRRCARSRAPAARRPGLAVTGVSTVPAWKSCGDWIQSSWMHSSAIMPARVTMPVIPRLVMYVGVLLSVARWKPRGCPYGDICRCASSRGRYAAPAR